MSAIEKIDNEMEAFLKEVEDARNRFATKAKEEWWSRIDVDRVAFENILIMYDQMAERLQPAPEKINEQGGMRWVKASERKPTREEVENRNGETVFLLTGLGERCSGNYNELTDSWYYHEEEQYKFEVVGASLEGLLWLDESTANELEEEVKRFDRNELSLIGSALNAYWHEAYNQIQRKDLGDLERVMYEKQLSNCKELMKKIE